MTRITAFMLFNQFSNSMSKNLKGMGKVQEQLATGKRLTKPSDDVIGLRGSMSYKVSINSVAQYGRNLQEGISSFALTESAISSATNLLNRARELAVSESNDVSSADDRAVTSFEVRNMFNQLVDIGNTKLKDKYIFSGYMTDTKTFDAAGTYQGDANNQQILIGDGIKSNIAISGDTAFNDTSKLVTGNLDTAMSGNLTITSGTGTPYYLEAADVLAGGTPEEIRDTINATMTGPYASTDEIGSGRLTFKVGGNAPETLDVLAPPDAGANNTPTQLRDAINLKNIGVTAGIFRDAANNQRLFLRPTTPGVGFSVEVTDDDGSHTDTSGLSALLHTDVNSNLTANALGVEAVLLDDGTNKRMILESSPAGSNFTIAVTGDGDGNDTDNAGLSMLSHAAGASNLSGNSWNSISFFDVLNHFANALETNNNIGVQSSILMVEGALSSVVNTTADVGSRLKYLEDQEFRLEDSEISYKKSLSVIEDADIAEAAMELTKIQSTLEAMRISAIKNLTQSLFDFLG